MRARVAALCGAWLLLAAGARAGARLDSLLVATPADSLVAPLRALEADRANPAEGGQAALALGHLHFARGEYRAAADAFARAAARLDPRRKLEARYWAGLSWLGLGEASQARAALEEAARSDSPRRIDALLGIAQAWELGRRPERALETLAEPMRADLGEAGPAVLERVAALSEQLGRAEPAREARERLLERYPRSIEAAAARLAQPLGLAGDQPGAVAVTIGSFIAPARARSLANEAKRAGFPAAQVITRGEGLAAVHVVRLGVYANRFEARRAGEEAARALGVEYQVGRTP